MIWSTTFLWLVTIFTLATTSYARETNAQRLSKGLPPLVPKRFASLPGYYSQPPTRVTVERSRTSPSSVPSQRFVRRGQPSTPHTYSGRVQVVDEAGSMLGFLSSNAMDGALDGINFHGQNNDLHVKFTVSGPLFDLIATNPSFSAPRFIGLSAASNNVLTIAALTNVPKISPSSVSKTRSTIWSFDEGTKELSAHYSVNGNKYPLTLAYEERENTFFFVGELAAHNLLNEFTAVQVKLYLVVDT